MHKASIPNTTASSKLDELRLVTLHMHETGDTRTALDLLLGVIASLQQDNERLLYRVKMADRARFGRRSERLSREELGQLVLALGGSEEQARENEPKVPVPDAPSEPKPSAPRKKHKGRTALDPNLVRKVTEIKVPEGERACVHCGAEMTCIGHALHEWVEYIPAHIEVHVERREKLACKACEQDIVTAPRSDIIRSECRAGFSLLAQLIEAKCDDALPINRQRDMLRRLGFAVPQNTLYGYWDYATGLLVPLAEVILSKVLGSPVVGIDDTRLDYLDPGDPRGKRRGHLWCFVGDTPLAAFAFTETWEAEDIAPWLWSTEGFIQCDDYKGYGAKLKNPDGSERVLVAPDLRLGCMMHVRRRFYQALLAGHVAGRRPVELIRSLYAVEREAKEREFGPPERHALRQEKSMAHLDELDAWVDAHRESFLPKSPLGAATRYAFLQREYVRRCFSDGRFEIDNGRVERELREVAIGRKNYLFSGSAAGARRLAAAYTVVQSARHAGLSVREYLIDVLGKLASGWRMKRIGELVPGAWKRAEAATYE